MRLDGRNRLVWVGVWMVSLGLSVRTQQGQSSATGTRTPAYESGNGPVIAFDEMHSNAGVSPYPQAMELFKADGYRTRSMAEKWSAASLADVRVLFIANPGELAMVDIIRNHGSRPPTAEEAQAAASLSAEELTAVLAWLKSGVSLLLVVGHEPYPLGAATLTVALGIPHWPNGSAGVRTELCTRGQDGRRSFPWCTAGGVVQSVFFWRTDFFPGGEPIFAEVEGAPPSNAKAYQSRDLVLAKHPITEGRSPTERIRRVQVGGSPSAFEAPPGYEPLLVLPPQAMLGTKPISGWLEGAVMEVGKGRLAVFSSSALIQGGTAADNRQFVLNVMHWLSRLL